MYRDHSVGVVVPAYNEEGFVGKVIKTIPEYVDRIYIIDDASTDNTWQEIQKTSKKVNKENKNKEFTKKAIPIQHEKNKGVGGAIKTGYQKALEDEIDVTAVMGGDGQMDPDHLNRIIDPIIEEEADYTKGNRLVYKDYRSGMSKWRFIGNSILTFLTKISSGYWKMMDPQNGYTAISNYALENVGISSMYEYYGYCNDLLVKLNAKGMRIADVAIPAVYGDENSHIKYSNYILKVSIMLLMNFLWRLKVKYLVLDFHPLALFYLFGAGTSTLGVLGGLWTLYLNHTKGVSLFMRGSLSLMIFTIGSLFLMFAMLFDMQVNEDNEKRIYE